MNVWLQCSSQPSQVFSQVSVTVLIFTIFICQYGTNTDESEQAQKPAQRDARYEPSTQLYPQKSAQVYLSTQVLPIKYQR